MHMPSRQRGRPSIDQQLQAAARAQEAAAASGGAAATADEESVERLGLRLTVRLAVLISV